MGNGETQLEAVLDLLNAYSKQIKNVDQDFSLEIKNKYSNYTFDNIFYTTETSEVK